MFHEVDYDLNCFIAQNSICGIRDRAFSLTCRSVYAKLYPSVYAGERKAGPAQRAAESQAYEALRASQWHGYFGQRPAARRHDI